MMSQCPICGQVARPGARFCMKCGRPFAQPVPVNNQPPQLSKTRDVVHIMSAGEILISATRLFFRYFFRLFSASLVGYAIWALMTIVLLLALQISIWIVPDTSPTIEILLGVVFGILLLSLTLAVINAPLTLAVSSLVLADRFSFANLVGAVFGRRLVRLLITVALQTLLVFLGSLLLFLPGIYLAIAFSMTPATVMLEDRSGRGALHRSRQLVRGYWWKTFGLVLVSYLLPLVVFLVPVLVVGSMPDSDVGMILLRGLFLLSTVGVPCFASVVQVLLYYDLRSRRGSFSAESLLTMPTLQAVYERI